MTRRGVVGLAALLSVSCTGVAQLSDSDASVTAGDASVSKDGSVVTFTDGSVIGSTDASVADASVVVMNPSDSGVAVDGGTVTPVACGAGCGANALCIDDLCRCVPGFQQSASTCMREAPPADPASRTKTEVCARWKAGHARVATAQYTPGTMGTCDPGVITQAAIYDAALRWNMFRWLVGLSPVSVDQSRAADMQQCALVLGYAFRHDPPPTTMCYTPGGADAASRSMICSGSDAAGCMNAYTLESTQTDNRLSHRKIVVAPTRDNVQFGVSSGGSCALYGYPTGALPAPPAFIAVPNPGPTPFEMASSSWSLHQTGAVLPIGTTTVFDETAGRALNVAQDLKYAGINAWNLQEALVADHTYRVTLTDGSNTVSYTTTPVNCQ